jgi:hypothetical protein
MKNRSTRGATFWVSLWLVVLLTCVGTVYLMARANVDVSGTGMSIFITAFGLVVASFSAWLAVRILNRREKWAIWTAVALPIPLYVLGVLPAGWLYTHHVLPDWGDGILELSYRPLIWLFEHPAALPYLMGLLLFSLPVFIISAISSTGSERQKIEGASAGNVVRPDGPR